MKLAVIIYSNDPETVWNAFRLANTSLGFDDEVSVFLLGKGVECTSLPTIKFNIAEQMMLFRELGGKLIGCGVCCEVREDVMPLIKEDLDCEIGSMQQLYGLVNECDKIISF